MTKGNPMKLPETARRAIETTVHREVDATAEKLARDILRSRPTDQGVDGIADRGRLKSALHQLGSNLERRRANHENQVGSNPIDSPHAPGLCSSVYVKSGATARNFKRDPIWPFPENRSGGPFLCEKRLINLVGCVGGEPTAAD